MTIGSLPEDQGAREFFYAKAAPDHYTFAGHYYTSGGHPSDADDEQRCTSSGGVWQKGYVALKAAPASAKK